MGSGAPAGGAGIVPGSYYGYAPEPLEVSFECEVRRDFLQGTAIRKKVAIRYRGPYGEGIIPLLLIVPVNIAGPVPVFLLINNREASDPELIATSPFWPAKEIIARGYAAAVFHVNDVDPDCHDGFRNGLHGLLEAGASQTRAGNAWGTIAAWAWGASRVMDYFETDEHMDSKRVAVVGHS
ncbi:hypothetical protein [Paenibacillus ginsengarvi]|uniref:4-O-methyl-glucuronoyl methylesterase-like domain-containing protein n=1 Tax=Paenibacillus ginsengarvi TaxID=400777 RepID=A0A3B0AQK4_9BACL|nr:hypothetical protein [Paenibacillus ginsengarvi]RKN61386.1 hypothetical protein D7M11_35350 [Paenibacillus ginsengarvi]